MRWWPFGGESEADKAARQSREHEAWLAAEALNQGKIPPKATMRLKELGESGEFTSGLAVKEMLLMREAGFKPIGQVMGSTFFHFGQVYVPVRQSARMTEVEKAQVKARRLALNRLKHEAAALGANGVVGVTLKMHEREWAHGVMEFAALGTAVRGPEPPTDEPWLSTLSGQDMWTLRQAGYRPCGVALGVAAEYVFPSIDTRRLLDGFRSYRSAEVTQFNQALLIARRRAEEELRDDAARFGAEGILGVTILPQITRLEVQGEEEYPTIMAKFIALGTGVVRAGQPVHQSPTLVRHLVDDALNIELDLDD